MLINHISVSRTSCYEQCPQLYKYKYHLRQPPTGEDPFYFVYGKVVHKTAEEYVRGGGKVGIGDVARAVVCGDVILEHNEAGEAVKTPPIPLEYRRRMPGHLRAIKTLTDRIGYDGRLEWKFRYDLDPPHGRCVTGFIDRLIERDGRFWILDYKTTKHGPYRKTAATVGGDLQLRTYAKVVQREFGADADKIQAALYYVEGGDLVETKFTQRSMDDAEAKMLKTYRAVEQHNPNEVWGRVGSWCKRCAYADVCPFQRAAAPVDMNRLPYHLQG